MIKDNFDYYIANQEEIVNGHLGEFVIIRNQAVVGYFNEEAKAFESMKDSELGTFIIKKCQEPGTDIINYFNNNVAFA